MTERNDDAPMDARDMLLQLLADDATEGLPAQQCAELERLLGEMPDVERDGLALAAAAADLALSGPAHEELPAHLAARILADGEAHLAARARGGDPLGASATVRPQAAAPPPATHASAAPDPSDPSEPAELRRLSAPWGGWLAAAAAALLAILGWMRDPGEAAPDTPGLPTTSLETQRTALIDSAPDLVQVSWSALEASYEGVSGDVVWSTAAQEGYMRLAGLAPNDPREAQYQLWIVDPGRDAEPVDGGIFDVSDTGEHVIAIDAKLAIGQPTVFALTLEQPGGVVVSEGPLLVAATVGA